jgi:hypothetical protein
MHVMQQEGKRRDPAMELNLSYGILRFDLFHIVFDRMPASRIGARKAEKGRCNLLVDSISAVALENPAHEQRERNRWRGFDRAAHVGNGTQIRPVRKPDSLV